MSDRRDPVFQRPARGDPGATSWSDDVVFVTTNIGIPVVGPAIWFSSTSGIRAHAVAELAFRLRENLDQPMPPIEFHPLADGTVQPIFATAPDYWVGRWTAQGPGNKKIGLQIERDGELLKVAIEENVLPEPYKISAARLSTARSIAEKYEADDWDPTLMNPEHALVRRRAPEIERFIVHGNPPPEGERQVRTFVRAIDALSVNEGCVLQSYGYFQNGTK